MRNSRPLAVLDERVREPRGRPAGRSARRRSAPPAPGPRPSPRPAPDATHVEDRQGQLARSARMPGGPNQLPVDPDAAGEAAPVETTRGEVVALATRCARWPPPADSRPGELGPALEQASTASPAGTFGGASGQLSAVERPRRHGTGVGARGAARSGSPSARCAVDVRNGLAAVYSKHLPPAARRSAPRRRPRTGAARAAASPAGRRACAGKFPVEVELAELEVPAATSLISVDMTNCRASSCEQSSARPPWHAGDDPRDRLPGEVERAHGTERRFELGGRQVAEDPGVAALAFRSRGEHEGAVDGPGPAHRETRARRSGDRSSRRAPCAGAPAAPRPGRPPPGRSAIYSRSPGRRRLPAEFRAGPEPSGPPAC